MPDIFGTAMGSSQALADMQRVAQTQGQQLANEQSALQLQEQQRMQALVQKEQDSGSLAGKSPVEQLESLADLSMRSGLVSSGSKMATTAADIRLKEAQTQHNTAMTFNQQALAAKSELDTAEKLLNGVTDQASWDAANSLFEKMSGKPSPFRGMDYNPAIVQQLRQSTLTLKDQLELKIKEFNAQSEDANRKNAQDFREFRKGILKQDQDLKAQRENRLAKAGGKNADVGVPGKAELDHAADLVSQDFTNLPQDEVNQAAFAIASRARALRKTTPGMDADTALDRAYLEAKQAGDFQTVDGAYKLTDPSTWFSGGKETHFTKTGKGSGQPTGNVLPMPASQTDLVPGQQYRNSKGDVATWTGKGFRLSEE